MRRASFIPGACRSAQTLGGLNKMSHSKISRRFKLLGSAAALILGLGMAGAASAQTCPGNYCAGTYTAISYPDVNGFIQVNLDPTLVVTTGGISMSTTTGAYLALYNAGVNSPSGVQITNTSGAGINIDAGAFGTVDLTMGRDGGYYGPANGPQSITGSTDGILTNGSGYIWTSTVDGSQAPGIWTGTVTGLNGYGINASFDGGMDMQLGSTIWGSMGAIHTSGSGSLNMRNEALGIIDGNLLLDNTGGVNITNRGIWRANGASNLGGATLTTITSDGPGIVSDKTAIVAVGGATEGAHTLTISGLTTWNNGGKILLGSNADFSGTDGMANDRLVVDGLTTFNGQANSAIYLDVDFGAGGQADCSAAVAADCVSLQGATVTGATQVVVNAAPGVGSVAPITLIDVTGGTSDAASFTLSDQSSGFAPIGGGVMRTALFDYELTYADGKYMLTPHANQGTLGLGRVEAMAQSIWDTTTGHYENRQADLRDSLEDLGSGSHPGAWLKLVGDGVERIESLRETIAAQPAVYETSYRQKTHGIVGGVDLLNVQGEDSAFVVGLTLGHVTSDVDMKATTAATSFEGSTYGIYGSYLSGPLFVDAIANVNDLDVDYDPAVGVSASGKAKTTGVQAEAGWRFAVNDGAAWLEPIATLAWVKSNIDALKLSDTLSADFGDGKVFKGALGLRVGGRMHTSSLTLGLAITGRVWNEFSGDHALTLTGSGSTLGLEDPQATLGDVGATFTLAAPTGRWSAFADYGFKFREGYSDSTASLGMRMNF